jgi:GMP synthase (glutamine-hydrolysing)
MITLINFRKERLLQNKPFNSEEDMNSHIKIIENEIKICNKDLRMRELRNWLSLFNNF